MESGIRGMTVALALRLPGDYPLLLGSRRVINQHGELAVVEQAQRAEQPTAGRDRFPFKVREPCALACVGLGESLWLPGSLADRKVKSLSCVANWSGSQRPRSVRRWLEPSLLNEALAERRGLDRFDDYQQMLFEQQTLKHTKDSSSPVY
jgi:hypothetical protein